MFTMDKETFKSLGAKKYATGLLTELNQEFEAEGGTSFTDVVVQTKSSGLVKEKSQKEKSNEKVKIQRGVQNQ